MKKNLKFMLIALTILYSCKSNVNVNQKYDDLKKIPYSTMSNDQKSTFEHAAIEKLKTDPDFIAVNNLIDKERINDPAVFETNKAKLILKMMLIAKKYPELTTLDKQTRKKIFNQASKNN